MVGWAENSTSVAFIVREHFYYIDILSETVPNYIYIWPVKITLLHSFSSFQIFSFSVNSKELLSNGPYAS